MHGQTNRNGFAKPLGLLLVATCWGLGILVPDLLLGQLAPARAQEEDVDSSSGRIFPTVPRLLRQAVSAVERAVDEGRTTDAVEQISELLAVLNGEVPEISKDENQDYFVPGPAGSATRISLRSKILGMLAALPAAGREAYETRHGITARKMLDQAVAAADIDKLNVVSRRYFHTKAGYEATYLLGRWNLEQGSPLAAALHLQRLVDSPGGAIRFEPEVSLLLASAWVSAGESERAQTVLVRWRDKFDPVTVRNGDKEIRVFTNDGEAVSWLEQNLGVRPLEQGSASSQWLVFGGNNSRTGLARGDLPLVYDDMQLRWQTLILNDKREDEEIRKLAKSAISESRPELPVLHALAVDDVILVRTPDRLIAVNFDTGKRIWEFPWDKDEETDPIAVATKAGGVTAAVSTPLEARMGRIRQRLWRDSPYGMIASDGRAVYLVHDLGFAPEVGPYQQMPWMFGPGGKRQRNPDFPKSYNQLVALDLKSEGTIHWVIGDENGQDEPKLAGAFFLGPPLPVADQLYVLAEIAGEIRLVALDPKTGKQIWSQQLALMEPNILNDPTRRLAGATPSYGDGVLVCPTAAGSVVAVDVATRSLLWAHEYRAPPEDDPNRRFIGGRVIIRSGAQPQSPNLGWADGTPIIYKGKVLLSPAEAPAEGGELLCLNLLTGEKFWTAPRGEGRYVGGVADERAIVVGKNSVVAINLADGKPVWTDPVEIPAGPEGGGRSMPSGRGFLSGGAYFLPTTDSEILKIDLASGKIVAKVKSADPLGNLICYRDEVISVNCESLSTYYQLTALRRRVADVLKERPNDLWACLRQAELQLYDGDRADALKTLRHASQVVAEHDPRRDELRNLLITTLLAELRANFAGSRQLAQEVESLIETQHRGDYLRTMAAGYQSIGESEQACATYLELLDLDAPLIDDGFDGGLPPLERRGATWEVRRDRAVQAELRKLFASAPTERRAALDRLLQARYDAAKAADAFTKLRQFASDFSFHPLANRARLELATRLVASGDFTEAEQWLVTPCVSDETDVQVSALALTAEIFGRVQRVEEAVAIYRDLATKYATIAALDGRTGRDITARLAATGPVGQLLQKPPVWLRGKAEVTETTGEGQRNIYGYRRTFPVAMRSNVGKQSESSQLAFDQTNGPHLVLTDGLGRTTMRVPLNHPSGQRPYVNNYSFHHAHARGHLIVALVGMEVVALDSLRPVDGSQERLLWRSDVATYTGVAGRPRTPSRQSSDNPLGVPRVAAYDMSGMQIGTLGPLLETGVCFQRGRELVCVDPLSGETLWSRGDVEPGSELFGDDDALVIAPPDKQLPGEPPPATVEALILNPLDGSELARREVPSFARRLAFQGRRVLTWTVEGASLVFQLLDPAQEGKTVWSLTAAEGSRGALVNDEDLGVLDPSGKFRLVSLADGTPRIEAQLQPEKEPLTDIRLLRYGDQYLLFANTAPPPIDASVMIQVAPGGPQTIMVHGRVYAFDRATGQPQWQTPAYIDQYGFPLDQPADLPVLVFLRHLQLRPPGRNPSLNTQILMVDRRDGRLRYEKGDLAQQTAFYTLTGDPATNKVTLELPGNRRFSLQFTDAPVPPEPPAQTGKASSLMVGRKSILGGVADGLLGGFGTGGIGLVPGVPNDPFGSDPFAPPGANNVRRVLRPPLPDLPFLPQPAPPAGDPFAP